jgi:hypothetical protein
MAGPAGAPRDPVSGPLLAAVRRTGPWRVASGKEWRTSAARMVAPGEAARPGCRARFARNTAHDGSHSAGSHRAGSHRAWISPARSSPV